MNFYEVVSTFLELSTSKKPLAVHLNIRVQGSKAMLMRSTARNRQRKQKGMKSEKFYADIGPEFIVEEEYKEERIHIRKP